MSLERRFIFIHVFKNAGTSIRRVLRPYSIAPWQAVANQVFKRIGVPQYRPSIVREHATASQVIEEFGQDTFASCFSFAFVRNPWDWEVSQYKYICKSPTHPWYAAISKMTGFPEYLDWKSRKNFKRQVDFLDHQEEQAVSFVGRFENLDTDFQVVAQKLNLRMKLAQRNATSAQSYESYYDQRSIDLIAGMYKPDIERFGYEFESCSSSSCSISNVA